MNLRHLIFLSVLLLSLIVQAQVPCNPLFTVSATSVNVSGNVVLFSGNSTFPVVGAIWNFSDGGSAYGWPQTQYAFNQPGNYAYCVEAWYWDPIAQDTCWADFCDSLFVGGSSSACDSTATVFFQATDFGNGQIFFNGTGSMLYNGYVWSFGDGASWTTSLPSVTYTYTQPGIYLACVDAWYYTATNDTCWVSYCDTLQILSAGSGCDSSSFVSFLPVDVGNNAMQFTATGNQAFVGYFWNFGDGSTGSSGMNPTTIHQYASPGTYVVCIEAWYFGNFNDTCWVSQCTTINVGAGVQDCDSVNWSVDFFPNVAGQFVQFTDQSNTAGFGATYFWEFGDGTSSTQQNPSHTYQLPGIYGPCLYVAIGINNGMDSCFMVHCDTVVISFSGGCDSTAFVDIGSTQISGNLFTFAATGNQLFGGYLWNFGDGSSTTTIGPQVTYQYPQPGGYTACVEAWYFTLLGDTCWVTDCISVNAGISSPCDSSAFVDLFAQNTFGNNYDFQLTGNQFFLFYEWNFGDGSASSSTIPFITHTYTLPGTYVVCVEAGYLTLTNDTCWVIDCDTIIVGGGSLICDSVNWSVDFFPNVAGQFVQFTDQSNTAGFGATYFWDFGDGTTSTLQNPAHTYQFPGIYGPCLYVAIGINNGADSCFMVHCDTVAISFLGGCDSTAFIDIAATQMSGQLYTFSATGNQLFGGYLWNFGDGSAASGPSPQINYQYPFSGIYTACVEAWYLTALGDTCWVSDCIMLNVSMSGPCDSTAYVDLTHNVGSGSTVDFTATGNQFFIIYQWDFGDGSTAIGTSLSASHTYNVSGTYLACVEAGFFGNMNDTCWVTACDTVIVLPSGIIDSNMGLEIGLFPNPAQDHMQIQSHSNLFINGYVLTDAFGSILKQSGFVRTQGLSLDVGDLSSGMYLLQISTEEGNVQKRIVVE